MIRFSPSLSSLSVTMMVEGGWDSSRHDSIYLNRVTPSKSHVYVTLMVSLEVENCEQPAVLRKDLCMRLHKERQTDGVFSRLLRGGIADVNMDSAIFTLTLKPATGVSLSWRKQ